MIDQLVLLLTLLLCTQAHSVERDDIQADSTENERIKPPEKVVRPVYELPPGVPSLFEEETKLKESLHHK